MNKNRKWQMLLVACLSAALLSADTSPNMTDKWKELQRRERDSYERSTAEYKTLPGSYKIQDILVQSADGMSFQPPAALVEQATNNPTGVQNPVRIRLEGVSDPVILVLSRDDQETLTGIRLTQSRFPADYLRFNSMVNCQFGTMLISGYWRTFDGGYQHVALETGADIPIHDIVQPGVRFSLTKDGRAGAKQEHITRSARTLDALNLQYPAEINQYVRPLLRDFGLESLLTIPPELAWQIFADELQPAAEHTREFRELLPALDADDFETRDQAIAKLQKMGVNGAIAAHHLDRSKLSAQQDAAINAAFVSFRSELPDKPAKFKSDAHFLLNCLNCTNQLMRETAWKHLKTLLPQPMEFDPAADEQTRQASVTAMRDVLFPADSPTSKPVIK